MENQEKTQKDQENLNQIESDMEAQIEGILGKDQDNAEKNKNENDQAQGAGSVNMSDLASLDFFKSLCSFPEVLAFNASTKDFTENQKKAVRDFFRPGDELLQDRMQVGTILIQKYFPSVSGEVSPELAALMVFVVPPVFSVVQAYQYKAASDNAIVTTAEKTSEAV